MATNDTGITARSLSLSDLLDGDLTLVIPDMQRDYCWRPSHVATFVGGIAYLYAEHRHATLGLLYGYHFPPGSTHIHIIDGQQRITTLYLLLGMLYRRVPEPWLRHLLISDYELLDDRQPRVLYQARREALYFTSDLVTRFFLDRDGRLSQLERSPWYYRSYDSDPTIQAFVAAIRSIDEVLERASMQPGWDFADFALFVAHDLDFIYADLGDRPDAESMFITINTTGEPLTSEQNMRSVSIELGLTDAPSRWNKIEDWCWANRSLFGDENIASTILSRLYRSWLELDGTREEEDPQKKFDGFYAFFKAILRVIKPGRDLGAEPITEVTTELKFIVLPTVAFVMRHPRATDAQIGRVAALLRNVTRYQRPAASGADAQSAIAMLRDMPTADLTSLLDVKRLPRRIANDEELAKLRLLARHGHRRLERLLARAERHPLLNGRVAKVIAWATDKRSGQVDLEALEHYVDAIYSIFGTDINAQPVLDPVRRALLTLQHRDYPIVRRGDYILSLCWYDYDWQRLMQTTDVLRLLIDNAQYKTIADMTQRYRNRENPYWFIINDPHALDNCRKRQLMRPCAAFLGIQRIGEAAEWHLMQRPMPEAKNWSPWRPYGTMCLYTDHAALNAAIDIYYTPDAKSPLRVEIFNRPDSDKQPISIKSVVSVIDRRYAIDKDRKRICYYMPDAGAAIELVRTLFEVIAGRETFA